MDRKSKLDELAKLREARTYGKTGTEQIREFGESGRIEEDDFVIDDNELDSFIVEEDVKKPTKRGKANEYYEEDDFYRKISEKERNDNMKRRTFRSMKEVQEIQREVKEVDEEEIKETEDLMNEIFDQLEDIDEEKAKREIDEFKRLEREQRMREIEIEMEIEKRAQHLKELRRNQVGTQRNSGKMEEEKPPVQNDTYGNIDFGELDLLVSNFKEEANKTKDIPKIKKTPLIIPNQKFSPGMENSIRGGFYFNRVVNNGGIKYNGSGMEENRNNSEIELSFKTIKDADGDDTEVVPFFWFDIVESKNSRNVIKFIGKIQDKKTGEFKSACLKVKNNYRYIYFCKKADSDISAFENEVREEVRNGILKFDDKIIFRQVSKRYAFELDIDVDEKLKVECFEVRIPFNYKFREISKGTIPFKYEGTYYKGVIGFTHSPIEIAQIQLKLKGPTWIPVQDPERVPKNKLKTWCDVELEVNDLDDIGVFKKEDKPTIKPDIKCLYLAFTKKEGDVKAHTIDSITILEYDSNCDFCEENPKVVPYLMSVHPFLNLSSSQSHEIKNKMEAIYGKNFKFFNEEYSMLKHFLEIFERINPDLIIGHEIESKLTILFNNMAHYVRGGKNSTDLEKFSSFSRFKKSPSDFKKLKNSYNKNYFLKDLINGRLYLNSYSAAEESMKEVDYSLEFLSSKYFKWEFSKVIKEDDLNSFQTMAKKVDISFQECYFSFLSVMKIQAVQLSIQLTNVAGCLWSLSLQNQRAKRNEMLLMHEFHDKDFLLPDILKMKHDPNYAKEHKQKVKKYEGGKVFEPKVGLHHSFTILLDFNSLYPSIIREYNLCFTTVKRRKYNVDFYLDPKKRIEYEIEMKEPKELTIQHNPDAWDREEYVKILPKIVATLIERRKTEKDLQKRARNPQEKMVRDIKQTAFKLVANSIYGCLGFPSSRFFSKDIASMITFYGRTLIEKTADKVAELGYEVIYGDTDSVMINSRQNDTIKTVETAYILKKEINRLFRRSSGQRILEVDIDGIFKSFLIHSKKKYAAMTLSNFDEVVNNARMVVAGELQPKFKLEVKGLDFVRRDWCNLTKTIGKDLLKIMLNQDDRDKTMSDIYDYLEIVGDKLRNQKYPLNEFIIYKVLKKDPKQYKDKTSQPHVCVADRLISEKVRTLDQLLNHSIGFIICKSEAASSLGQRAYHISEVRNNNFKIDYDYYADVQISNPLHRIIQYLEGIDLERVAKAIGINPNKLLKTGNRIFNSTEELTSEFVQSRLPGNYKFVKWKCPNLTIKTGNYCEKENFYTIKDPFQCIGCSYVLNSNQILNLLRKIISERTVNYYQTVQECQECGEQVDNLSLSEKCEHCDTELKTNIQYTSHDVNADIHSFVEILENLMSKEPFKHETLNKEILIGFVKYLKGNFEAKSSFRRVNLGEFTKTCEVWRKNNLRNNRANKLYRLLQSGQGRRYGNTR